MKTLFETVSLRVAFEHEEAYLLDKPIGATLLTDIFYGDPECALIATDESWAVIAGDHVTGWTPQRWQRIEAEGLEWICALRQKDRNTVELLVDPWSELAAVWEIDIELFTATKIRPFPNYRDRPFIDQPEW